MDEILFHIGAPRTATTLLQATLRVSRESLRAAGVNYLGPEDIRGSDVFRDFWRFYSEQQDWIGSRSELAELILGGRSRAIFSEEGLTGRFMPGEVRSAGMEGIERTIEFLRDIPVYRKRIVLTVRRQDKYIYSCYTHAVKYRGEKEIFAKWFNKEVRLQNFSWKRVVDCLADAFGAENLTVVPQEHLSEASIEDFVRACIVSVAPDPKLTLPKAGRVNVSLGENGLQIARRTNDLIGDKGLRTQVNGIIATTLKEPSFKPAIAPQVYKRCRTLFAEENAALRATYFPDKGSEFTFD